MTSYAVVAIPSPDDYIWQLSSEKVPHLTMLFLGEHIDNLDQVTEFVRHVADTSLSRFMLEVDHRGVLGDKSADVLFFSNYCIDKLQNARSYLLGNSDIRNAYNSVEQFPSWTPHLTMGYPETPAKPDTREYPGTQWVQFDRIALWTGDYEGVEFPLKKEGAVDLTMSDVAVRGQQFLEHFGVKGMKWGVRHDPQTNDAKLAMVREKDRQARVADKLKQKKLVDLKPSKDAREAGFVKTKAKISGVNTLSNQDLQILITRMNLERQFKDLRQVEHDESLIGMGKKWTANFITDVLKDAAASWLKRPGSNFSGRTSAKAWTTGQNFGRIINGTTVPQRAIGS